MSPSVTIRSPRTNNVTRYTVCPHESSSVSTLRARYLIHVVQIDNPNTKRAYRLFRDLKAEHKRERWIWHSDVHDVRESSLSNRKNSVHYCPKSWRSHWDMLTYHFLVTISSHKSLLSFVTEYVHTKYGGYNVV